MTKEQVAAVTAEQLEGSIFNYVTGARLRCTTASSGVGSTWVGSFSAQKTDWESIL